MGNGMTLITLFCIHTYMILKNKEKLYLRSENKNFVMYHIFYLCPP